MYRNATFRGLPYPTQSTLSSLMGLTYTRYETTI